MNLAALLNHSATVWRDRPALASGAEILASHGALHDRVTRLAAGLRGGLGLDAGDRVALAMTNRPEFCEILLACWHGGLAAVPMNARLHPREFAYILENSGARACFTTENLTAAIASIADEAPALDQVIETGGADYEALAGTAPMAMVDVAADDLAWLFYTSGTTGRPKGAMLSHRNLMAATLAYFADVDPIAPTDCIIHAAPMSHGSGLYILPHIAKGACQVVPQSGGFEPAEIFDLLRAHRGATFFFAPTMVTRFLDAPGLSDADLSNLKTIVYGGAPMYKADCRRALAALGSKLVQIYGQGESPMTITCLSRAIHADSANPSYGERLGSVGVPFTGVEVRLTDETGAECVPGDVGEITVRGDVVMEGYWRNTEASAEALRGGWLHTGDMGAMDEDGFLTLKDRSKDVIISGGSNIYPREVEEVLLRHDSVHEVSVVGQPHADWGESVVAFVVPREGAEVPDGELDALCLENIARFKRPRAYHRLDALPKNNYGKVLKTALRDLLDKS